MFGRATRQYERISENDVSTLDSVTHVWFLTVSMEKNYTFVNFVGI